MLRRAVLLAEIRSLQRTLDLRLQSREDLLKNLEMSRKLDRLIDRYYTLE